MPMCLSTSPSDANSALIDGNIISIYLCGSDKEISPEITLNISSFILFFLVISIRDVLFSCNSCILRNTTINLAFSEFLLSNTDKTLDTSPIASGLIFPALMILKPPMASSAYKSGLDASNWANLSISNFTIFERISTISFFNKSRLRLNCSILSIESADALSSIISGIFPISLAWSSGILEAIAANLVSNFESSSTLLLNCITRTSLSSNTLRNSALLALFVLFSVTRLCPIDSNNFLLASFTRILTSENMLLAPVLKCSSFSLSTSARSSNTKRLCSVGKYPRPPITKSTASSNFWLYFALPGIFSNSSNSLVNPLTLNLK